MDADIHVADLVLANSLNRTGSQTLSALDAESSFHYDPSTAPVGKSAGRTDLGAGRRVAGKTPISDEASREPASGMDTNPCGMPGDLFMDQSGTGQGAGLAPNALIQAWCGELFHYWCSRFGVLRGITNVSNLSLYTKTGKVAFPVALRRKTSSTNHQVPAGDLPQGFGWRKRFLPFFLWLG